MTELSGEPPKMWGPSIVGFGSYKYKGKTSQGEWMRIAFSPRKANLSVYLMNGYNEYGLILSKLGKHKIGKACLYINKLDDIDLEVLKELMKASLKYMDEQYPKDKQ